MVEVEIDGLGVLRTPRGGRIAGRVSRKLQHERAVMIRSIALIGLILATLGGSATRSRADWVKFTSPDKKFEAQFPSDPKESEQKTAGAPTKMYSALDGTTSYTITATNVPALAKADAATLAKTMDNSRDTLINAVKGKLVSDKKVELDTKDTGREFIVEAMGGVVHLRQRMFIVDGVLYQLIVGGTSANAINGKDADMFVKSFKLKK
jgi:hypothetical protein